MDKRFIGNTLNYLEAMSRVARSSLRKRSFQRGSLRYIPKLHGTYEDLLTNFNSSVGSSSIWKRNKVFACHLKQYCHLLRSGMA
jgi:hypothetical protein